MTPKPAIAYVYILSVAPRQAYGGCTVKVKGGHCVFGSVVRCHRCQVECMQVLSQTLNVKLVLQMSSPGLYAHRHHTHPLTTGALQNGQNGQNGAKWCKTGAKRCKTVQNGAKWVQNGCKMGANRLNGQKRRWGNGGRMVGLWWMTTLTSLPEDCMHIATPWTSFPLSMQLL